ncbi:S1 RNA-binding domain-containing protein [Streptomyces sp. NPDC015130]|uniref:S1 RNA-binding domain-containing protein n=1 Tax=Streptomyces sp. NPDC015130 TaxID=3364940 RepID=UPI0036F9D452
MESLHRGEILSGTVAAIERFGVFVVLVDGPAHPTLPGVGFINIPELSWRHIDAPTDVVQVGQRVSCAVLGINTFHAEASLSLKALRPKSSCQPAGSFFPGQRLAGTKMVHRPRDSRRAQAVGVGLPNPATNATPCYPCVQGGARCQLPVPALGDRPMTSLNPGVPRSTMRLGRCSWSSRWLSLCSAPARLTRSPRSHRAGPRVQPSPCAPRGCCPGSPPASSVARDRGAAMRTARRRARGRTRCRTRVRRCPRRACAVRSGRGKSPTS